MKMRVLLAFACALSLVMTGIAQADEIEDLKKKIEMLEQTTQELKNELGALQEKQAAQAETVKQIESQPSAASAVSEALSKNVNIGAHFKFFLADYTDGERNNVDQNNNLSAGISDIWLYFNKSLTDWMSIEIAPRIEVMAGATPALGSDIDRSNTASVNIDIDEAYLSMYLPWELETKVGAIYPFFSEEYASKTWWHEQYHANNGLVTLENWQSTGIELYRNFDFENFSLPVYFYPYLNGENRSRQNDSRYTDNNSNKSILLHLAPEAYLFGGRFRLLSSLGYGRWDDDGDNDSWQYALGTDITYKAFNVSAEYLARLREDYTLSDGSTEDADDKGWYARVLYTLNPEWRFLLKYSDVDLYSPSQDKMFTDNYKALCFAINYWITQGSTIIPQLEYVNASRSGEDEDLEYLRWTFGWRTTF